MNKLPEVNNYIVFKNGKIVTKNIQDSIVVENDYILIKDDTTLQINYLSNEDNQYELDIEIIANKQVDLIELYQLNNTCTYNKNIILKANSKLTRYVENDNNSSCTINDHVSVEQDANVTCAYVELANNSNNLNSNYDLIGQGANATIRLASLSQDSQKKYYKISLNHLSPITSGDMDNYGIVKTKGSLIIDGIGTIKKGNYQSSTNQTNKIIVFDEGCVAQANPYLYIDEYDVKASHGASVGKIDEDHLYYLQSRGLSKQDAMHLVTYGYFLPVLDFINVESLKERFSEVLKEKVGL